MADHLPTASTPGHVLHITRVGYEYVCECGDWRWKPDLAQHLPGLVFADVEAEAWGRHGDHVAAATGATAHP